MSEYILAAQFIYSSWQNDKAENARYRANRPPPADLTTEILNDASADEALPVYYGFCAKVDPIVVFRDTKNFASYPYAHPPGLVVGVPYTFVIAVIGEGEIAAVDAIYLDGVEVNDPRLAGLVQWDVRLGTDTQTASVLLNNIPGRFASTDVGKGVAYVVLALKVNTLAFPGREPKIQFDIRGKKVKDTRDGVTRFSPNPALAIRDLWTNARYGRKVAEAKINDATITTEANYFEERIALPANALGVARVYTSTEVSGNLFTFAADTPFDNGDGVRISSTGTVPTGLAAGTTYYWMRGPRTAAATGRSTPAGITASRSGSLASSYANALAGVPINVTGPGSGTITLTHFDQARYQCGGRIDPSANPLDNLAALRSSCRSWFFESGGLYHLIADKVAAAAFDLTVDNVVGSWNINMGDPQAHFNRVEAHFFSAVLGDDDLALSDNSSELAADGGRLMNGRLDLPLTQNPYQAQRLAQMERRASRLGMRVGLTATIQGLKMACGDVVRLTHPDPGFANKLFRVTAIDLPENEEYPVQLAEYADAVFTMDSQAAMAMPDRTTLVSLLNSITQFPPGTSGLAIFGQGTSTVWTGRDCKLVWRRASNTGSFEFGSEAFGGNSGAPDPALDYLVKILKTDGTLLRQEYVKENAYTYTYEKNFEDTGGAPVRDFKAMVWARNQALLSAVPAQIEVTNPQPQPPTEILLTASLRQVNVRYNAPSDPDLAGVLVFMDTAQGFTPSGTKAGEGNCVYDGLDQLPVVKGDPNTAYYVRLASFDTFDRAGLFLSDEFRVVTAAVADSAGISLTGTFSDGLGAQPPSPNPCSLSFEIGFPVLAVGVLQGLTLDAPLADLVVNVQMHGKIARSATANGGTLEEFCGMIASADIASGTYGAGTVSLAINQVNCLDRYVDVTGSGTAFLANVAPGDRLLVPGQPPMIWRSVVDDTHGTAYLRDWFYQALNWGDRPSLVSANGLSGKSYLSYRRQFPDFGGGTGFPALILVTSPLSGGSLAKGESKVIDATLSGVVNLPFPELEAKSLVFFSVLGVSNPFTIASGDGPNYTISEVGLSYAIFKK